MKKRVVFIISFVIFLLSACSDIDDLSGKNFDISVPGSPLEPGNLQSIMTFEFSNGNIVKNTKGNEEGTYELIDDKLFIHFENENEKVEIEFTLEESDQDYRGYAAVISDAVFQVEDVEQVSEYKGLYFKLPRPDSYFAFVQR